jgi:hypothetical protein
MRQAPTKRLSPFGIAVRIAVLLCLVVAATWVTQLLREALDMQFMKENEQQVHWALMFGTIAYIGLLALPFVPGAEIGIAMLTTFGAAIAPLIYSSTVLAMMLSFAVGRLLPIRLLSGLLSALRMRRTADLVARAEPLSREDRLELLLEGSPPKTVALALRYRYLAIAIAVNVPGNSVIGGGGGIMMIAGLSGLFSPMATLLTMMIAVAPVPLVVAIFGG